VQNRGVSHSRRAQAPNRYNRPLSIKEILVSGDLTAVRLVRTLKITNIESGVQAVTKETGMDIFRRQPDGNWKIFRCIAYESRR
jgi:ketosteroid isomerase-like protein